MSDAVTSPVVSLRDVQKSFGSLKVLDGVSFEVERGQVTAIIGRSGSGKSTALRCIDRLERIDGGEIVVCGHRVSDPDIDLRKLRLDVGIVFQSYNLFPHKTALQNIMMAPVTVLKQSKAEVEARAHALLKKVRLAARRAPIPASCRAGSSSAWRSPARWRCSPTSCCSTR